MLEATVWEMIYTSVEMYEIEWMLLPVIGDGKIAWYVCGQLARPTTNIALALSRGKQTIDWFSKHENGCRW
jgi:hypothetical protein